MLIAFDSSRRHHAGQAECDTTERLRVVPGDRVQYPDLIHASSSNPDRLRIATVTRRMTLDHTHE